MPYRISDMADAAAAGLGIPIEKARNLSKVLRRAGLITSTNARGVNAPRMRVQDVSNMILGALAARVVNDAPRAVRLARGLALDYYCDVSGMYEGDPPPPDGLFGLAPQHTFGELVDTLVGEYKHGDVRYPPSDFVVTHLDLEVAVPGSMARVRVWSGGYKWGACYIDRPKDAPGAPPRDGSGPEHQAAVDKFCLERYGAAPGMMQVRRLITDHSLYELGRFLYFGRHDVDLGDDYDPPPDERDDAEGDETNQTDDSAAARVAA